MSVNGETIRVTLEFESSYMLHSDPVALTATITLYDDTGEAAILLSGTAMAGETLTIMTDSNDPDGNESGGFTYGWEYRARPADRWNRGRLQSACGSAASCTLPASIRAGGYVRGSINYTDGNGLLTEVYTAPISPLAAANDIEAGGGGDGIRRWEHGDLYSGVESAPRVNVTIAVASGATTAATVNPTSLTFHYHRRHHLEHVGGHQGVRSQRR